MENPTADQTEQVVLSKRLKDYPFTIRAMSTKEFSEYQKGATHISKGRSVEFDSGKFQTSVIINHTIEPSFKDAEMLKKANCLTPEQFLDKFLRAGEAAELAQRISALSGFDQNMEEVVQEAKNS
jgi:hypothetical protein